MGPFLGLTGEKLKKSPLKCLETEVSAFPYISSVQ